jgi:glycerol-3-phosphate dehydrogenase (NAD(P)+)
MTRVAILGAGAFGTALALLTRQAGHRVRVWANEEDLPARVAAEGENAAFLPGVPVPAEVAFTGDVAFALESADLVLLVTPAQFVRKVAERARAHVPRAAFVVCCAKGIEENSLALMHEVLAETMPDSANRHAFLSGPSFAKEIAAGLPTDVTVAARDIALARAVQSALHTPIFRVYASDDPTGVLVAGALKNVIAIACGAVDEMGLGLSARSSLVTRGLAEITRVGVAMGARAVTFLGLAGVGDLVLTCTGDLSRNRTLGRELARGKPVAEIVASQRAVAEGYHTARPAWALARKLAVDAPITEQVYHVLHEGRSLIEAARLLMVRSPKDETWGFA